jgi:phosphatidylglycerol:prolipoprotein diacylglycerol transferase
LIGYGLARFAVEFVRQYDPQLGLLFGALTMGQLLSLPMIALGAWLFARTRRRLALDGG